MSNLENLQELLKSAQIVDVDFSKWDQYLALLILDTSQRSEAEVVSGARRFLPLWEVRLIDPQRLSVNFKHSSTKSKLHSDQHIQWTVIDSEIVRGDDSAFLRIKSSGAEPELTCEMSAVELGEIDVNDALTVAPWWGRRRSPPFIRPSIVEIAGILRR